MDMDPPLDGLRRDDRVEKLNKEGTPCLNY